ncbi:uncharacterized protein LOC110715434 [Chenopodium quinoa]|uniref:uncharacterized protein LOC110715434 n=1 Tax=Chenopodium quinoa TaxID=63459 RepID=UPI000B792637|nr:uncharacterized protein LOC110715434 [Chenopodium quinoa]
MSNQVYNLIINDFNYLCYTLLFGFASVISNNHIFQSHRIMKDTRFYFVTCRLRAIAKENVDCDGEIGFHLERNDLQHKLIWRRLSSKNRGNEHRRKFKGRFPGAPARSAISSYELQRGLQSQSDGHCQRDPYREATRALAYMGSLETPPPTVTRDDLRRRSPTRSAYNSGCLLPPTHKTELQKVTSIRSIGPLGSQHTYSHMFPGPPRSTVPAQTVTLMDPERTRPMAFIPSPSGFLPRSLSMVEAPVTVAGLLNSLGLGKYTIHFQAEEVDMSALKLMSEKDLKDLGILMGPRKKILQALSALLRRQLPRQL